MVTTNEPHSVAQFGLEIRPLTGRIGAEVNGLRLSGALQPATVRAVQVALLQHKVLFFRGQTHLDDQEQQAFGRLLGKLVPHPTVPSLDGTDVLDIDGTRSRASSWHTDVTFVDAYPKISILRSVVVPERGGDTVWANTVTAYQDLPEPLKNFVDSAWALHSNAYDYVVPNPSATGGPGEEKLRQNRAVFTSTLYETEHPLVHVHPETGERALILGHFIQKIIGFNAVRSAQLFSLLQDYVVQPENVVRWRWSAGDVAIWDNRATQHRAIDDYGDQARILHRVTLDGDVPVSIDGRRSTTRRKEVRAAA